MSSENCINIDKYKSWIRKNALTVTCISLISLTHGFSTNWPTTIIGYSTIPLTIEDFDWLFSYVELIVLLAIFPTAYISDRFGRKKTMFLCSSLYAVSWIIILSLRTIIGLYLSVIISLLAQQIFYVVFPIYLGEIARKNNRGVIVGLMCCIHLLGFIISNLLNSSVEWIILAGVYIVFSILFMIAFAFQQESPYYYLMRGQKDLAEKSFQVLYHEEDVSILFSEEKKMVEEHINTSNVLKKLWTDQFKLLHPALTVGLLYHQLHYDSALYIIEQFKYIVVLDVNGVFMVIYFVGLALLCSVIILNDLFGRKPLLIFAYVIAILAYLFYGFYYYYLFSSLNDAFATIAFFQLTICMPIVRANSFLLISEMFHTKLKSYMNASIICLGTILYYVSTGITIKYFNLHSHNWINTFFTTLGLVIVLKYLPETKRLSLSEIQKKVYNRNNVDNNNNNPD